MSAPTQRPVVGALLGAIAVIHLLITPLVYPEPSRSILQARVVASVEADPELADLRGAGFWYATCGLALLVLSWFVGAEERRDGVPSRAAVVGIAAIGVWGVVFMPVSGFVSLVVLAGYAGVRRRRAGSAGQGRPWGPGQPSRVSARWASRSTTGTNRR